DDQNGFCGSSCRARVAHERTQLSSAITSSAVGVGSSVRRKRYHQEEIIRFAEFAGMSPRSSSTNPKPPPCNNRSVALNACSRLRSQRIQSRRSQFIPARAAVSGSNELLVSTNAQISSLLVARVSADNITLVRPEEAGPNTSVIAPRGNPPSANESISTMPVGITSDG